jgi:predicted  nucleic acid-binding Zn-ribbon protein
MKAVSASVATIGRSINAMNEPLGAYRAAAGRITEAERIHAALSDIATDIAKSKEKEGRTSGRIRELNERIAGCERALAELEHERSGTDLAGRQEEITRRAGEREETVRQYAALSMTAAHVLRKAEKVARRQKKPLDERAIQHAIALLSHHAVPDSEELVPALAAAYLPAKRMIDAGEVPLKNKEERSLFTTPDGFSNEIRTLCTTFSRQASAYEAAEREFSAHPVIARHAVLTRERKLLSDTRAKEEQSCHELLHWRDELAKKIPALREQLTKTVGGISGSDVQIHFPDEGARSP